MKVYCDYEVITVDPELPVLQNTLDKTMWYKSEMLKYKLMWGLRSLEERINAEGGMIIIRTAGTGEVDPIGFSPDLVEAMRPLVIAAIGNSRKR